jgi:hypothetical protein
MSQAKTVIQPDFSVNFGFDQWTCGHDHPATGYHLVKPLTLGLNPQPLHPTSRLQRSGLTNIPQLVSAGATLLVKCEASVIMARYSNPKKIGK